MFSATLESGLSRFQSRNVFRYFGIWLKPIPKSKCFSRLRNLAKPIPKFKTGQTRCATGQWGVWLLVQGTRFHPSGLPQCRLCCSEDSAEGVGCQGHLRRRSGRCPLLPSPFHPSARKCNDVLTARSACLCYRDTRNLLPVTRILIKKVATISNNNKCTGKAEMESV